MSNEQFQRPPTPAEIAQITKLADTICVAMASHSNDWGHAIVQAIRQGKCPGVNPDIIVAIAAITLAVSAARRAGTMNREGFLAMSMTQWDGSEPAKPEEPPKKEAMN